MKAEELRIGNLLDNCGQWCYVMGIYKNNKAELGYYKDSIGFIRTLDGLQIKPIPLTKKWWAKCGFIKDGSYYTWEWMKFYEAEDYYRPDNYYFSEAFSDDFQLRYVHQLQNLFFALTGEELAIPI
jgi:hypothetical protein